MMNIIFRCYYGDVCWYWGVIIYRLGGIEVVCCYYCGLLNCYVESLIRFCLNEDIVKD